MTTATSAPKNLSELLEISQSRATYQNQVIVARQKFESSCNASFNGNFFTVDPVMIAYIESRVNVGADKDIVMNNSNHPVTIEDLEEFLDLIQSTYYEALNEFADELERLKKSRKPEKIVEAPEGV